MTQAETTKKRAYTRGAGPHRHRSIGLPASYWDYLARRADREQETVTRLMRLALEARYPEIKSNGGQQ